MSLSGSVLEPVPFFSVDFFLDAQDSTEAFSRRIPLLFTSNTEIPHFQLLVNDLSEADAFLFQPQRDARHPVILFLLILLIEAHATPAFGL